VQNRCCLGATESALGARHYDPRQLLPHYVYALHALIHRRARPNAGLAERNAIAVDLDQLAVRTTSRTDRGGDAPRPCMAASSERIDDTARASAERWRPSRQTSRSRKTILAQDRRTRQRARSAARHSNHLHSREH